MGLGGAAYELIVMRRARHASYRPVLEDWLFHVVLPLVSYLTLAGAALLLGAHAPLSLFFVAGATLLLLLIGIHNTWDTVTYIAFSDQAEQSHPDH